MAAQAVLDKALSPEVQAIVGSDASDDEKIKAMRHCLFGQAKTIIPEFVNG